MRMKIKTGLNEDVDSFVDELHRFVVHLHIVEPLLLLLSPDVWQESPLSSVDASALTKSIRSLIHPRSIVIFGGTLKPKKNKATDQLLNLICAYLIWNRHSKDNQQYSVLYIHNHDNIESNQDNQIDK